MVGEELYWANICYRFSESVYHLTGSTVWTNPLHSKPMSQGLGDSCPYSHQRSPNSSVYRISITTNMWYSFQLLSQGAKHWDRSLSWHIHPVEILTWFWWSENACYDRSSTTTNALSLYSSVYNNYLVRIELKIET